MDELRENLAEYAHDAWAGWMKYLFDKGQLNSDGTFIIPKWAVDRWIRQSNTSYGNLSNEEKDLDRLEAKRILEIFRENDAPWFERAEAAKSRAATLAEQLEQANQFAAEQAREAGAREDELRKAIENIVPFIHENNMTGETEYEQAVLSLERALERVVQGTQAPPEEE